LQQKGLGLVGRRADLGGDLFKDMTPELERDLPGPFEEDIKRIKEFEPEAAHCATG
jgi:hypothetical protein